METCALCKKEEKLCESHIIPKFVYNWIKKTSATGYLRQAINKNKRIQDGTKEKLLCKDCELKLSKYEDYFAKKFFYPYVNKTKTSFDYDENLQKFIISISWRLLRSDLNKIKKDQLEMFEHAKVAEEHWRIILLNDKTDEEYEHHLFLLDYIKDSSEDLPKHFNGYIMRATDGTTASNSKEIFVFSKVPKILFISSISPKNIQNYWEGTLVNNAGIICISQTCKYPGFLDFLCRRSQKIGEPSKKQQNKIKETMLKDLERVRKSKTFELWKEELKRKDNNIE